MSRWVLAAILMLMLGLIAGCAVPRTDQLLPETPGFETTIIKDVPGFEQRFQQCGAASLASMLHWSGIEVSPQELEPLLYNPERRGTLQHALISAARRHGVLAYEIQGRDELLAQLEALIPVLVLQNRSLAWFPFWHYAVVCGLDPASNTICLLDGDRQPRWLKAELFMRTWSMADYWGLLALPPGVMPADANQQRYLQAVFALEQVGQHSAAKKGYQAALEKWPGELGALLGLANCLYSLDDLPEAERVLRQAVKTHPESAPAWNNLAQVLYEQGRQGPALEAAHKAVSLGGEYLQHYQQTMEKIRRPGQ